MIFRKYMHLKIALMAFDRSEYRNISIDRYKINDDGTVFLFRKRSINSNPYDHYLVMELGGVLQGTAQLNRFNPLLIKKIPKYFLRKGIDI